MFGSVKAKIALAAELIMPWLVAVLAVPTFYYWNRMDTEWEIQINSEAYFHAWRIFDLIYNIVIATGALVIIAEVIIAVVSFVVMIVSIVKKTKCVTYMMLVLFLCAPLCIFGTLALVIIVMAFTYGQGV